MSVSIRRGRRRNVRALAHEPPLTKLFLWTVSLLTVVVAAPGALRLAGNDAQLFELHLLAERCEEVFGAGRDLEWAFAGDALHLLQCRAVTRTA